jgi:YD repeat-containing protein
MNTIRLLFSISFFTLPYFSIGQNTLTTKKYEYDDNHQLTKTIYSNGKTYTYIYDELGNRKQKIISISCVLPTAFLSGSTEIEQGQSTNLKLNTAGKTPYNLQIDGQQYQTNNGELSVSVSPQATTTYSVSQITNQCGLGNASGSATVTVVPRIIRPDMVIQSFNVYQFTEYEMVFSLVVKNIGEKAASMLDFSVGAVTSSNNTHEQSDSFNNVWLTSSPYELEPNQELTMFLRTPINYKNNEHYYIFLPDYFGHIQESNESNNPKTYLVRKCQGDTLRLSGSLTQPAYFGKNKIILENGANPTVSTLLIAPSIEGIPTFSVTQNNTIMIPGTCNNDPGFIPGTIPSTQNSQDQIKLVNPKNAETFSFILKQKDKLSISIWDGKNKVGDIAKEKRFNEGLIELDITTVSLKSDRNYMMLIETSLGKNLIELKKQ